MAFGKLILDRYRPISEAGAGGFGTVHVAWDTRIQRKVAIKTIQLNDVEAARAHFENAQAALPAGAPYEQGDQSFEPEYHEAEVVSYELPDETPPEEEFTPEHSMANIPGLDEARTAAMLTDSNIVTVYDFEVKGTTAYLIMEFVEGITLTKLLREHSDDITLDVVAAVFSAVSHALEVAHKNQVLHLDIKPDNVLINREGQVKVTDFGLATFADANGFGTAGAGTIGYMPPEQIRQESLDARTDEWSLASLTYEMLVGENPFLTKNLNQAAALIEEAELVLPSLCWDDIDPAIDDVVFRALDPDREERYPTVAEFANELEPFLGNAKAGRKALSNMVSGVSDEEENPEKSEPKPHIPLMERVSDKVAGVLARLCALAGVGILGWFAFSNIPPIQGTEEYFIWVALGVLGVATLIKPHIGALLTYLSLAVAMFFAQAYIVAVLLIVAACAWWFFVARAGNIQSCVGLIAPAAGAFGFAPLAPVVSGGMLPLVHALVSTVFAIAISMLTASFGSLSMVDWDVLYYQNLSFSNIQTDMVTVFLDPATWFIGGSWLLATLIFSLACERGTKAFDVVGSILAAIVLLVGAFLAEGALTLPLFVATALPAALGVAGAALGVCDRARWGSEETETE